MRFLKISYCILMLSLSFTFLTEKTSEIPDQQSEPVPLSNDNDKKEGR